MPPRFLGRFINTRNIRSAIVLLNSIAGLSLSDRGQFAMFFVMAAMSTHELLMVTSASSILDRNDQFNWCSKITI